MHYNYLKQNKLERISFNQNTHHFFDSFIIKGSERYFLGLEDFPQVIDAAGLCICLEGQCEIIIGTQGYLMQKGDMCVILPNNILHVRKKSPDFNGYIIICASDFLINSEIPSPSRAPIYLFIKDNPCISLSEKEQSELIKMCEILKEHDSRVDHPCRYEISKNLGYAIIYEVIGIYKNKKPLSQQSYSRKDILYFEFIQLISKHYKEQRKVEFYAEELCITSRYLSAVCKEITGYTAKEYIDQHIIIIARTLLAATDLTVLQISDELNFSNPSFFTQYFKKQTGITPNKFRISNKTA